MDIELNDPKANAALVASQLSVINYLKKQSAQLEHELVVALLMTYGVDVRKEGVTIDLEHGVLHVPGPTPNEQQRLHDAPSTPSGRDEADAGPTGQTGS